MNQEIHSGDEVFIKDIPSAILVAVYIYDDDIVCSDGNGNQYSFPAGTLEKIEAHAEHS